MDFREETGGGYVLDDHPMKKELRDIKITKFPKVKVIRYKVLPNLEMKMII
jgi:hypothetical protein